MQSIGGFYYVAAEDKVFECRGRGALRSKGITPTVGDRCKITVPEGSSDKNLSVVDEILPRRNVLVRPAVANLDKLFIVVSSCKPRPNPLIIDRLIAAAEYDDIEPVLVLTKLDLGDLSSLEAIYKSAGFRVITADYDKPESLREVRDEMRGALSAFAGNSGVGKSTLLNAICPQLSQETGETSEKLGRGKHTTRSVQLFCIEKDTYIADTPGFSSFDGDLGMRIPAGKLEMCFREFSPYLGKCKFVSCAHIKDQGCAVLEAVEKGIENETENGIENKSSGISKDRFDSYAVMYEEARQKKEWEK